MCVSIVNTLNIQSFLLNIKAYYDYLTQQSHFYAHKSVVKLHFYAHKNVNYYIFLRFIVFLRLLLGCGNHNFSDADTLRLLVSKANSCCNIVGRKYAAHAVFP